MDPLLKYLKHKIGEVRMVEQHSLVLDRLKPHIDKFATRRQF